ncbi:MAG: ATP-dependent helicase, partial [Proteobacteria bacterium]|nr:ATP-dependent helicase [Pseudomonadota bacterium]
AIIIGQLTTDETDEEICDSENFEILLRIARADAIPSFEPVNIEWLPLYLATYQKLTNPSNDIDQLFGCLEQLVCYPAEAGKWESEILPARAHPYSISMLDTIMQEGDLKWIGSENRRVTFCFESDLDLMQEKTAPSEPEQTNRATHLFPDPTGRYDFSTLMRTSNMSPGELSDRLWEAVWQSRVTNDTFASLRKGIENRFKVAKSGLSEARSRIKTRRPGSRTGFARWKGSVPFAGNWYKLPALEISEDLIEIEERKKDRVRILFDRYGILFRELLVN